MTRAKGVAVRQKRRARPGEKVNPLLRGLKQEVARGEIEATMAEPATVHMQHDSWYWSPNIDEAERVNPVTVYDGEGKVLRVITKEELMRRNIDEGAMYKNNFHLFVKDK